MTSFVQAEHNHVTATLLSEAVKSSTPSSSLCSTILKTIVSLFVRHQPATVESLTSTSSESIVLADDVHTQLIPTSYHNTNHNTQQHQHEHQTPLLTPVIHITHQPTTTTTISTIHSQSTLYFTTTQPSSSTSFSFYSCSSCSSLSFMASASCASTTIAPPLPFICSPTTTFNNSSAGHFRPLCINVNADDSRVYRRLLVQLEETERRFDDFWNTHLIRLKQCLDLRRFEQDFRELQVRVSSIHPSFKIVVVAYPHRWNKTGNYSDEFYFAD